MITSFICSLSLEFAEKRYIYSYCELKTNKNELIYFINTSLIKYFCRLNPYDNKKNIIHIYIPLDDLYFLIRKILFLLYKVIKSFPNFSNIKFSRFKEVKIKNKLNIKKEFKKTALIIHGSLSYGNLYYKNHYFSNKTNSPLNHANILLFVINKQNNIKEKYKNNQIIDLKNEPKIKHYFITLKSFIESLYLLRNCKQFIGLIF